jgi:uncharacterized membrane protein
MIQSVEPLDRLVEEYLAAVADACAGLAPSRRDELVADLREHIAVARAGLRQPGEADIRSILDRLGEPDAIAAEARVGEPSVPARPRGTTPPPRASRPSAYGAVIAVAVLGFLAVLLAMAVGLVLVVQAP